MLQNSTSIPESNNYDIIWPRSLHFNCIVLYKNYGVIVWLLINLNRIKKAKIKISVLPNLFFFEFLFPNFLFSFSNKNHQLPVSFRVPHSPSCPNSTPWSISSFQIPFQIPFDLYSYCLRLNCFNSFLTCLLFSNPSTIKHQIKPSKTYSLIT